MNLYATGIRIFGQLIPHSHLEFECSSIIKLSIQHVTDFNIALHMSPPSSGIIFFIIAMNKIFKDDLQKEKPVCPLVSAMYICLKSKHVTQSSLCTANFSILFFVEYTYLLIFHSFLCLLVYSISIDFIFVIMNTNHVHHIFTALPESLADIERDCCSRERRSGLCSKYCSENNLDCGSVLFSAFFFLPFSFIFLFANSQQIPPQKCTVLNFQVYSFLVFVFITIS